MEMLGWLGVIAMLIGFVFSILILMGKKKGGIDVGAKWKTPMSAGLLVVGVAGLLMTPFASYIPGLSTFAITAPEPTTTFSTPNGQTDLEVHVVPVNTLSVGVCLWGSNACGTYSGTLRVFPEDQDPSDPTSSTIDTVTISSGTGSTTNKRLMTDTLYWFVLDGGGTYYDVDLGRREISDENFNYNTGDYGITFDDVITVATIGDIFNGSNESSTNSDRFNGQDRSTDGELNVTHGTEGEIWYDESAGDGQVYVEMDFGVSGAYSGIKDPVVCFESADTNGAEGNEITQIYVSTVTGENSFSGVNDFVNFFANDECISMGSFMEGGETANYKWTITYNEANLDTNDDFYVYMDDLGAIKAKDVITSNTGATYDRIKFDATA